MLIAAALLALLAPQDRKPVDLIKLLDADQDSIAGDWTVDGGTLASPKRARPPRIHLLQIPYIPPEEYDLTLVVESKGPFDPKGDTTSLDVGLPLGEMRPTAIFDGWDGTVRGISDIKGKNASENETTSRARVFVDGTARTIVYAVRKNSLTVTVDGKAAIEWKGDPNDSMSSGAYFEIPDRRTLFLGAWIAYVFKKVELVPVTGAGSVVARRTKSRFVGGRGGAGFDDSPLRPAMLVGLRYWTSRYGAGIIVKAAQGIYRTDEGPAEGKPYGRPNGAPGEVVAKPGYAIGAIVARGGDRVDGCRIVFMRVAEKGLDPKDSYESEWLGGSGGGGETLLGGGGVPIVGLAGRSFEDLDCIGVVQAEVPLSVLDPARTLADRLKEPEAAARADACAKLGRMGAEALSAIDPLIETLRNDAQADVRTAAARALGSIGPSAVPAIPPMIEALKHGEPGVRAASAWALGRLGPAARPALPALHDVLSDASPAARKEALLSIASLGPEARSIAAMLDLFRKDLLKDERIRASASDPEQWISGSGPETPDLQPVWTFLRALATVGPEAIPALAPALKHEDAAYRAIAAAALALIGPEARAALPMLLESMQDKDVIVRRMAIKAVLEVDDRGTGVLAAMREAVRDEDERVQTIARDAVRRLSLLSLRLRAGETFSVATTSKMLVEYAEGKATVEIEEVVEYEVLGATAAEENPEIPDLPLPPGFAIHDSRDGSSPSRSFRSVARTLRGTSTDLPATIRAYAVQLARLGWTLDPSAEPGTILGTKKGERISVENPGKAPNGEASLLLRVVPFRNGRRMAEEASTDRGPVNLKGRYKSLKAKGSDSKGAFELDWDLARKSVQMTGVECDLTRRIREVVPHEFYATVDRSGKFERDVRDPILTPQPFPALSLSMPGTLPEEADRKEESWKTPPPDDWTPALTLEHRFQKREAGEIVIASQGKLVAEKIEASATTTFDPRSGRPVKSQGRCTQASEVAKFTLEFEATFTPAR